MVQEFKRSGRKAECVIYLESESGEILSVTVKADSGSESVIKSTVYSMIPTDNIRVEKNE